ncbi:MAG: hypothetical protein PHC61_09265 [Chitinivibrionales bacterium]|nr:hypothetical protein [Chitinivibrionales bacterium]
MPSHQFKYPFFEPPGRSAGPYLPIKITNPKENKSIEWYCLIDTGADSCLFSATVADILGHHLTGLSVKSSITKGVEGRTVRTWKHSFIISLMHPTQPGKIVWQSKKSLIDCIEHNECPLLLGVEDFLEHFRLTLDYRKKIAMLAW